MTHSLTQEAFAALGGPELVYIRPVKAQDILSNLPPGARYQAPLVPDQVLYALHSADGARLAVLVDRDSAYAAARAHELAPVAVHWRLTDGIASRRRGRRLQRKKGVHRIDCPGLA